MDLNNYRERILADDEFVYAEFKKLQVLFEMKRVIRYHHSREEVTDTESVAEHVYGILCLVEFFLPLEDTTQKLDKEKVTQMVIFHDVDEIVTGDKIGYLKTKNDINNERIAQNQLIQKLPEILQGNLLSLLDEYEEQKTTESRFVKALDKLEPVFHLYNKNGKSILKTNKTTIEQHRIIKDKYMISFQCINRFNKVMTTIMEREGFFHKT